MRTREEVQTVQRLAGRQLGAAEISRLTGIPAPTVHRWLGGRTPRFREPETLDEPAYSYLLGLYLGDGHLAAFPRAYCLRIYLDSRYPGIIVACMAAMQSVMPENRVNAIPRRGCTTVLCYSTRWPALLPQHGSGAKHERPIELEHWQAAITNRHPRELVRGLIHSDGSRFLNPVVSRGRRYAYPRYFFSNASEDIKAIFCSHLDLLGIEWRRAGRMNISIARREAVAKLDEFVGPKR